MNDSRLEAILLDEDGICRVLSPAVGDFNYLVSQGVPLGGGGRIGRMRILNRLYDVVLPAHSSGRVSLDPETDFAVEVGYKEELLILDRSIDAGGEMTPNRREREKEEIGPGFVVRAFTTGIFYRRSSPDAPPFVDVGTAVEPGKVLGLIEVMKSFNQIVFSGDETCSHGTIAKILAEDTQEVKNGDPLFVIANHGGK